MAVYPARLRWTGFFLIGLLAAVVGAGLGWTAPGWLAWAGWLALLPGGAGAAAFCLWVLLRRDPALALTPRGVWRATGLFSPPRLIPWDNLLSVRVERRFGMRYLSLVLAQERPGWLHGRGRVQVAAYELDRPPEALVSLLEQYRCHAAARAELAEWEPGPRA